MTRTAVPVFTIALAVGAALLVTVAPFPLGLVGWGIAGAVVVGGVAAMLASSGLARTEVPRTMWAWALVPCVALLGLNGLRVGGVLSWGDVALLVCVPFALAIALRGRLDYRVLLWWTVLPAGLLIIAGGAALLVRGDPSSAGVVAVQIILALVVGPLALGTVASVSTRATVALAAAWAVSIIVNTVVAGIELATDMRVGTYLPGTAITVYRLAALTTHPNVLGLLGAMAFPVLVASATASRRNGLRVLFAIAAIASIGAVLASGSRASLLALPAATLAFLWAQLRAGDRRGAARGAGVGLVAIVAGAVLVLSATPELAIGLDRLSGAVDVAGSDELRLATFYDNVRAFGSSPIFGVGLVSLRAGSLYLEIPAATGVIGVLAFMLAIGGAALALLRNGLRLRGVDPFLAAVAAGAFGSLVAWLVYGIGQPAISDRFLYLPAAVGVACVLRTQVAARRSERG